MKTAGVDWIGISGLVAFVLMLPESGRACEIDRFNFTWGTDVGTHMAVKSPDSCKFGVKVNPRGHLQSAVLSQAPQHGTVTQTDATHWLYHPSRGFAGHDALAVRLNGDLMTNRRVYSGETNVSYEIDVSP